MSAKQISSLIVAKDRLPEQSTTQHQTPLPQNLVDLLFLRFGSIYGQIWSKRHLNETEWQITKDEWANALGKVPLEDIKKSIDQLRDAKSEFPPTLPAFLSMCKSNKKQDFFEHKKLPWNRQDSQNIKSIFEKIKSVNFENDIHHPVWEKSKCTPGSRKFNLNYFLERKNYLTNLSDLDSISLCLDDSYDRIRFLRTMEHQLNYPELYS